jgi:hypothetical protein
VAYGKEKNYRLDYFDSRGGVLKGSIHLAGYHVKPIKASEPLRIVLSPVRETRGSVLADTTGEIVDSSRKWVLYCKTEAERDTWTSVFETICDRLRPGYKEVLQPTTSQVEVVQWTETETTPSSSKRIELSASRANIEIFTTYTFSFVDGQTILSYDSADASIGPGTIDLNDYKYTDRGQTEFRLVPNDVVDINDINSSALSKVWRLQFKSEAQCLELISFVMQTCVELPTTDASSTLLIDASKRKSSNGYLLLNKF